MYVSHSPQRERGLGAQTEERFASEFWGHSLSTSFLSRLVILKATQMTTMTSGNSYIVIRTMGHGTLSAPHCTDKKKEGQGSGAACSRLHGKQVSGLGFEPLAQASAPSSPSLVLTCNLAGGIQLRFSFAFKWQMTPSIFTSIDGLLVFAISVQVFHPFKMFCLFFLLSYGFSLYILDTNSLVGSSFMNIFSKSVVCLFIFLLVSSDEHF